MKYIFILLAAVFLNGTLHAKVVFPDRGRTAVYDPSHVLPDKERTVLNQNLVGWQNKTKHQLVIAIISDLQGLDISDYGYQLGRAWHLGQNGQDDAILLLVNPHDGKNTIRIDVGSDLESIITDGKAHSIRTEIMNPAYKTGGLSAALFAGSNAITSYIDTHEKDIPVRHRLAPKSKAGGDLFGLLVLLALAGSAVYVILQQRRNKNQVKGNLNLYQPPVPTYRNSSYAQRVRTPARKTFYPESYDRTDSSTGDFLTGAALGVATSSLLNDSDNDDNRRSIIDDGFSSDNTDFNNFSGGGDSGDLGGDDS